MIGLLRYNDQSLSLTCEALLTRIVAMAGKEAEKRLHETDDELTAPFEHQQKVKSKKYMQKWKDEYYKLENMEKSTKGPHFAHCGVCHRDFSISHGGRNDITKHCASSTHKEAYWKAGAVLADFGCGDGHLAESLPKHKVHSFDLVASKPFITACNIARVPLENSSVDVAVFCLSLMGTNLSDYLCEANRVLKQGGTLRVTEVVSRFYSVNNFVKNVEALGFRHQKKVFLGKMFLLFKFKKVAEASRKKAPRIQLKACQYKKR